jgi:hypothetical protein
MNKPAKKVICRKRQLLRATYSESLFIFLSIDGRFYKKQPYFALAMLDFLKVLFLCCQIENFKKSELPTSRCYKQPDNVTQINLS